MFWSRLKNNLDFKTLFLLSVIVLVGAIIIFDLGDFNIHDSGAGDIWWTEVENMW